MASLGGRTHRRPKRQSWRDETAGDFRFVASAYGFADADLEEKVAERDW
ncbi:DUF5713 family protein [Streptomyces niveus]